VLQQFKQEKMRFLNMEMETAAILALGNLLGHQAASLSVILAQRDKQDFAEDPEALEAQLIETGLHLIVNW